MIVLHPGGFKAGNAGPANVAQDMALAGFLGLAVEYRLAPPHDPMNPPRHPFPGQNQVRPVDGGHYPEQTDDVQLAIRTARADPDAMVESTVLADLPVVRTCSTWLRLELLVMIGPI